jgi:hypothetical protein
VVLWIFKEPLALEKVENQRQDQRTTGSSSVKNFKESTVFMKEPAKNLWWFFDFLKKFENHGPCQNQLFEIF